MELGLVACDGGCIKGMIYLFIFQIYQNFEIVKKFKLILNQLKIDKKGHPLTI